MPPLAERRNHFVLPIFSRRRFLKLGFLAAAGAAAGAGFLLTSGRKPLVRKSSPKKVVIIGAGPSGLAAAYELAQVGHDVSLIEARSRPGGRVYTVREPFADGMYAEAGAARIPPGHDLTLDYVKRFNLTLDPVYPTSGSFVSSLEGEREVVNWQGYSSAASEAVGMDLGRDSGQWSKIRGGTDLLPRAFAERLAGKIIYGAPVVRIEQDALQVRTVFSESGTYQNISGDYLICTLPFTVLRHVDVSPPFSSHTRSAVDEMRYSSVTRVFLQMKTRSWKDSGLNGFAVTDDPMEIWQPTFDQPGTRGILVSYARYGYSRRLTAMGEAERLAHMLDQMDRLFPGVRSQYESGASHCWDTDPWARGAWAESTYWRGLGPEGRIHLAGDHLSSNSAWLQGAFQSAHRVAHEVNDAP